MAANGTLVQVVFSYYRWSEVGQEPNSSGTLTEILPEHFSRTDDVRPLPDCNWIHVYNTRAGVLHLEPVVLLSASNTAQAVAANSTRQQKGSLGPSGGDRGQDAAFNRQSITAPPAWTI